MAKLKRVDVWGNRRQGYKITRDNEVVSNGWIRQSDAIEEATDIAKAAQAELVIHGHDGRIRARNSYGHDPKKSKG